MDFDARYKALNPGQRQAVDAIDGPVMVIAGPGTGKTELLGMRVANILRQTDTLANTILCLTFTDSGAAAMRERLAEIIGTESYKVSIHTFHSFGSEIINQNGQYFYQGANFRPADELSTYELIRKIFDGLEHDNPLASMLNDEYTYLGDALTAISDIKKSGLTNDELLMVLDANDVVIEAAERLLRPIFSERISTNTARRLRTVVEPLRSSGGEVTLVTIAPLSRVLADSLQTALDEAESATSTKPITAWRTQWLKKNEAGEYILKSRDRQKKLRTLNYIYYQYLARMLEAEQYDFDDMILKVIHAMEVFPDLRFDLQERYQYILVDEFQDTNMAQMRILVNLTSNDVSEGRPNIMVVGDDDQAIYSFQGADVGNISRFEELFPDMTRVTLQDNYRSTPDILARSRQVITLARDRLEARLPDVDKTLIPHAAAAGSAVRLFEHATAPGERHWLAKNIAETIASGTPPDTIAVFASRHHELVSLLPYLARHNIAVSYERHDNVLDNELVTLVETLSKVIVAIFEQRFTDADSWLPEVLAHPAFAIPPLDVWQMSLRAYKNHQTWLETFAEDARFTRLHEWLIALAHAVPHTPLERLLDQIIGAASPPHDEPAAGFASPIYSYYFGAGKLNQSPEDYLLYLEALRAIRGKVRDYRPDSPQTLATFTECIGLHRQRNSRITSIVPAAKNQPAINLMTAHKSKGQEFDTVYIIGAIDSSWGERVRLRSRLIGYPENLPLRQAGDSIDERIRLFFVAMTRAKKALNISYSLSDENGKPTMRASFLAGEDWQAQVIPAPDDTTTRLSQAKLQWYGPLIAPIQPDMRTALTPLLQNYKLSITHLNNFLDVTRGGPQYFLMQNLLNFPRAPLPSASYGVAVHAALQQAHTHLCATGSQKPLEDVLRDYETSLSKQRLTSTDHGYFLQKGIDALTVFLKVKYASFSRTQKVEVNFSGQSVQIGPARLTGKLDVVDIQGDALSIIDYKTGKPSSSWRGSTEYGKIKLHKYKQQLMFYDILLKNSKDYARYAIDKRILQFVEPDFQGDIVHLEADYSQEEYERFCQLIQVVWQHITQLDLPDISRFETNYKGILAFEDYLLDE